MAARPMCQRHMGKNAVVDRLALSAAKPVRQSVAVNAGWTRRALEIIGIRRNQGNKSGVRRTVDPNELTVVTGGGSGIGRAVALRLARRGMNVIITGRRGGPLEDTKALAAESGFTGEVIPVVADSTSEEGRQGVADAVSKLKEDKGFVLRGLIHNAAVNTPCKKMMDLDQDEWLKVSDINVNGPLFLTQKLYPYFGKTETDKNRVMMLSSVARTCSGLPAYGPYCVSKLSFYGLHLMFKEEMSKGVTPVYSASLIPGEVDTEMQRQTAYGQADGTFPEHLVQYWREIQESGQLLPPEVTGAFMEYVLIDTAPTEYGDDEWFIYDKKHHKDWAYEFPDVNIVEPQGLF
uniref:Ketoreductase domain-containing protein n=1 Tax=Lotharella globosa TaxID=91324 RepID=A0A7S3ZEU2_9EUKA